MERDDVAPQRKAKFKNIMNRVLVLSPSPQLADTIKDALPVDWHINRCDIAEKALILNRTMPFDLVFADLHCIKAASVTSDYADAATLFQKTNPLIEFVVLTSKDSVREAVQAVKAGASDYLTYPVDSAEIKLVATSIIQMLSQRLELEYLRGQFWKTEWIDIVHSQSQAVQNIYENVRAVAPTIASVLLMGETGTGKSLLARLIHWHSNRCEAPFVAVHCGAIPETLLESELFGHEKGAFTGAIRKNLGKFELANTGTIFLDEIGTITPLAQVKLLQVLQDGTFSRVGGEDQLKTNARIIAATNSDLNALSNEGQFRRDLYFRLNVFPIDIPPLRDRIEDLRHLVELFLKQLNNRYGKRIYSVHPAVMEAFKAYAWPGNLRELENVLERAYILETGSKLMPQRFPANLLGAEEFVTIKAPETDLPLSEARQRATAAFELGYLQNLLIRHTGRINRAAEAAEITPRQLNRLMSRYNMDKRDFKK